MSASEPVEIERPSASRFVGRLDEMLQELGAAVADCTPVSDVERIDRIARLEKLRAVTAALQAAESVRFAQSQAEEQLAADVHRTRSVMVLPSRSGSRVASPLWWQRSG
jgi:hypothetical protein